MRDVPTLGPAPAAQANSFGLIRISDALSRLSILAIARLLDSVNFNSLGRQASTVAVVVGTLNHLPSSLNKSPASARGTHLPCAISILPGYHPLIEPSLH